MVALRIMTMPTTTTTMIMMMMSMKLPVKVMMLIVNRNLMNIDTDDARDHGENDDHDDEKISDAYDDGVGGNYCNVVDRLDYDNDTND